jgi:hypothetical protein
MTYEDFDETKAFNCHSPGPVKSDEQLLRCGFHPENFDESGQLVPSILPIEHLRLKQPAEKSGCSIDRLAHSSRAHLQDKLNTLSAHNPESRRKGIIIQFACFEIRAISDLYYNQAFKVIDIAYMNDTSHAVILAAREYKDSYLRKLRNDVLDVWRKKPSKSICDIFMIQGA